MSMHGWRRWAAMALAVAGASVVLAAYLRPASVAALLQLTAFCR